MTEVTFSDTQFFTIIMFTLWFFIISIIYSGKDVNSNTNPNTKPDFILYFIQFIIATPLYLFLLGNTFLQGLDMGTGLGIGVLSASVYFVIVGYGYASE